MAAAAAPPPGGLVDSAPGFGWTTGEFSVSDDGAAQYSLPLWMPRARGDKVTPQLGLSFDSRAGNGLLGVGWSLGGLSSISWCPRTYAQDGFTEGAHFDGTSALCLGGMRLLPTSAAQAPQREYVTERQTFARIVGYGTQDHVPDYFKVWAKDGTIQTFGQSDDSRLEAYRLQPGPDPENPNLVRAPDGRVTLAWAVDKIEDRNGNAATVEYLRAEGDEAELSWVEMRPAVISYEPNRRVEFAYESRTDLIDSFGGGVQTRTAHRLDTISMFAGPAGGDAELLREYQLRYENDSITGRSLLSNIAECDGEHICKTSLPLTWTKGSYEFEEIVENGTVENLPDRFMAGDVDGDGADDMIYRLQDLNDEEPEQLIVRLGSRNGRQFGFPHVSIETPADDAINFRPVDVDVDGKAELMVSIPQDDGTTPWDLYESDGWDYEPVPGGPLGDVGVDSSFLFADLDGNGLPDFVGSEREDGSSPWERHYRLNTGAAGADRFGDRTDVPDFAAEQNARFVADTDGDGRGEVRTGFDIQPPHYFGWGLNAVGGIEGASYNGPAPSGDVNGDGLDDFVKDDWNEEIEESELRVRRNSGNGLDSMFTVPVPDDWPGQTIEDIEDNGFASNRIRVLDFNNDGRSDILAIPSGRLYQWTGSEFARAQFDVDPGGGIDGGWPNVQPMDYNGDGLMDLVSISPGPDTDERRLRIFKRLGDMPDQLVRIGEPNLTQTVDFSYTNLADRSVHNPAEDCSYPIVCPFKGGSVVEEHSVAARVEGGEVSWLTYQHAYGGARVDLRGRGSLGFARHVVGHLGSVTITDFDNQTRDVGATSEYAEAEVYPYANMPKQMTYKVKDDPDGREYQRTVSYDNKIRRQDAGSYTVETTTVVTSDEERPVDGPEWELLRRSQVDTEYDEFGNKALETTATGGGRRTTEAVDYRNDEGPWLIGLPIARQVTGCATEQDCVTRTTTYDYDDNGNPAVSVVEPDDPELKLTTVTEYGEFGTVESVTRTDDAGNSRGEAYTYDADRLYPTSTIDALEHETTTKMHSGLGVVLEATDPNGVKTTMRYDGFGRLVETNEADGGFEHSTHGALGYQQISTNSAGGGHTSVLLDSLGREIEQRVRTFDGQTATVFTAYDERGRVSTRSRPTLPEHTPQFTTYTYDNRDRVVSVTDPNGAATRHDYVGLETHTIDPRNTHSYTVANVDGDVESRYEDDPDSSAWLRTRFEYGPFGLPNRMVAADETTQTMRYDTLGRPTRHVDPSSGTTETAYNAFGEPMSQTNGADEETTFRYDELGRVERATSPDGTATNTWDSTENGIGHLAAATSADGVVTRYTYDEFGHEQTRSWNIDGETYQLDYGYDEFGRQASLTYPQIPDVQDRLRIDYTYNTHGYLQQIKNPVEPTPYWQGTSRNAEGALTEEHLGNGVVSRYGYEPTTGRLTQVATTGPAEQLQELSLEYDPNGNLTSKSDDVSGRVEEFGYDRLNRLRTWSVTSGGGPTENTSYDYNAIGNLVSENVDGMPERDVTYRYGENGAPQHALTSRNTDHYTYDDAGRQISGPRRTVEYNRLDLPSSITWGQPQQETVYRYDANGVRVRKHDSGQTVTYVGGVFERRDTAGTGGKEIHNLHYILAEGRVVAQINRVQSADGGPLTTTRSWHLHADHQASTMVVTNKAGRPVADSDDFLNELFYDPFGRRIDADSNPLGRQRHGGVRFGFNGDEHEDETGLINMNGRIYDPEGRSFLSPDPLLQDPLNSQNHNRYSYVWNNPTTYTDPSGYHTMAIAAACGGGSAWDCWELTAMSVQGVVEQAFTNFLILAFSLTATPGFDEDSTATTVPAATPLPDCVPECLPPGYVVNDDGVIEGGSEVIVVTPQGAEPVEEWPDSDATTRALLWRQYLTDVATHIQHKVAQTANDDDGKVSFGNIGPYTVTGQGPRWNKPTLPTLSPGGISAGGGLNSLSLEAKAKGNLYGFQLEQALTAEGASLGLGASLGADGLAGSFDASLFELGTSGKGCLPLIRVCLGGSLGVKPGIGGRVALGPDGFSWKINPGAFAVGQSVSYDGVDENVFRAAGAPGNGKWFAVRDLILGKW